MSDFFDIPVRAVKTKTYPTLYSRDTTGNIREWFLEQEGNKYRTHAGVQNGQFIISDWEVVQGKNVGRANETTSIDQATKEILAKYKKQRESGYFDDVTQIDNFQYFQPYEKCTNQLVNIYAVNLLEKELNANQLHFSSC